MMPTMYQNFEEAAKNYVMSRLATAKVECSFTYFEYPCFWYIKIEDCGRSVTRKFSSLHLSQSHSRNLEHILRECKDMISLLVQEPMNGGVYSNLIKQLEKAKDGTISLNKKISEIELKQQIIEEAYDAL